MKYFFLVLLFCFTTIPAFAYNSGFTPVYQPNGGGSANLASIHEIGNVTEIGCVVGQILEVNSTGFWACANDDTGAAGNFFDNIANTNAINTTLIADNSTVIGRATFKTVSAGSGVSIIDGPNNIIISSTNSGNATLLDELGDVVLSSPAYLSTLFYDGMEWIDKIFSIDSITCNVGDFVNIINNQTGQTACGTPTGSGFNNIASVSISANATMVSDNSTVANRATFKTISAGTGIQIDNGTQSIIIKNTGFTNIAKTNTANTTSVLSDNSTVVGRATFKSLSAGTGISLTNNDNDIVITNSAPASGGVTVLGGANLTSASVNSYTTIFTIPLTASSGNFVSAYLVADSEIGTAVQVYANVTGSNNWGTCTIDTPLTSSTFETDVLQVGSGAITDTGTTAWFTNNATAIQLQCSIQSGTSPGNLKLNFQTEVTNINARILPGSYYIKTP